MTGPLLSGIRVLEVAMWGFVPAAGVVLADWGADVIKVEHPVHGDPMRGLLTAGLIPGSYGVNFMWELHNRGKRSVGIDLRHPDGLALVYRMAREVDVFLTSFLPGARRELRIDVDDIRAHKPDVVYGRGSGMGPQGPEADRGGYDLAAFWARSGVAYKATPPGAEIPVSLPGPGFGDVQSGLVLAGGIAAALLRRERTGEGAVIDVSLLHTGMWAMSNEITATALLGMDAFYVGDRSNVPNPIVAPYRTRDGRFVQLVMLEADRHWPDLCRHINRPDLIDDPRFRDQQLRAEHSQECVAILEEVFSSRTLAEWRDALATATGVWAVVQLPRELPDDPQVQANEYVRRDANAAGTEYEAVTNPVQVDGFQPRQRPAPEHGQQTEEVLLELGFSWGDIAGFKESGAVL